MRTAISAHRPIGLALLVIVALASVALPAHAVSFLRVQQLPELVEESTRAVMGEVVEVRYGFDEQRLHSTWVTLRVADALYGDVPGPGGLLTFKIYGAPQPLEDGSRIFLDGTPMYTAGQRYLVLLIRESRWGFTNTAGLYQGAFLLDDANRVRRLDPHDEMFGEGGLVTLLGGDGTTEVQPGRQPGFDDIVDYARLRQAITGLWLDNGGRLHSGLPGPMQLPQDEPAPPAGDTPRGLAAPGAPR